MAKAKAKKFNLKNFVRQKGEKTGTLPLKRYIYFSTGLSLFLIIVVFVAQNSLPPEVPLFYGLAEGSDQLTTSTGLMLPGIFSLTVLIINILITYLVENKFLQKTLILTGVAISVFSSVTVVKIIFLVGSFNIF